MLMLNGVVQGYATDLVVQFLKQTGWRNSLVKVGEFHAGAKVWSLEVPDPSHGISKTVKLKNRAIATSSQSAMQLNSGRSHILDPAWSAVSVQEADATTACCVRADGVVRTLTP